MSEWTVNTYTVIIERVGSKRVEAMWAIRRSQPYLQLADARDLVNNLPSKAIQEADAQDAFTLAKRLLEADCDVRVIERAREYMAGCWAGDVETPILSETVQEVPHDWWATD